MQKVVVVIPIHKSDPTPNELASFAQCYKVLGKHPIRIVAPEGLDTNAYTNTVPHCEFIFIDKTWLSSVEQYNKLKISLYFYNLFKDYEFLLTYELDAWVFRDELLYWCDKGYDYIGAPWFEETGYGYSMKMTTGANSGFSLRRISVSISLLKQVHRVLKVRKIWYRTKLQSIFRFEKSGFIETLLKIRLTPSFSGLYGLKHNHEDYFWSDYVYSTFPTFRLAPKDECTKFSFEVNPSFLYEKNDRRLPFGCHGWEKYEPEFWKEFIGKLYIM